MLPADDHPTLAAQGATWCRPDPDAPLSQVSWSLGAVLHRFVCRVVLTACIFRDWATQDHCLAGDPRVALGIGPRAEMHPIAPTALTVHRTRAITTSDVARAGHRHTKAACGALLMSSLS